MKLPLDQMTTEEKLRAMEALWADLTRNETRYESPKWHGEILQERAARVKQGKETFEHWEAAKQQLRQKSK